MAAKGDLVVVVEVRTRGPRSFETALSSISKTKQRTLLRAVRALWVRYLTRMPNVRRVRIDVAAVTIDDDAASIEWIAGAITEDDV